MGFLRPSVTVAVLAAVTVAQLPFSVIPTISDELRAKALDTRATRFMRLWEYALKVDGQGPGPAIRVNFEAKTILAPGPLAYFNLIPQDASDPLYGRSKPMQALRRNFLLDHLVLDPVEASDPKLEEGDGVRALTFTGKDIYFKKDKQGNITVGGVAVQEVHDKGYIHNDLMDVNVVVDEATGRVSIIDFGNACRPGQNAGYGASSNDNLAPEILGGGSSTTASDVFSVGFMLGQICDEMARPSSELRRLARKMQSAKPRQRPALSAAIKRLNS
ncbi:uncharacterized protein LOC119591336, partial [Penaeus monodon]|uniref:uncharacterized protein LOC119591336 n=1 Tax=Penaeus monodon TaxID=6687 RepID=UPI0018A6DF10